MNIIENLFFSITKRRALDTAHTRKIIWKSKFKSGSSFKLPSVSVKSQKKQMHWLVSQYFFRCTNSWGVLFKEKHCSEISRYCPLTGFKALNFKLNWWENFPLMQMSIDQILQSLIEVAKHVPFYFSWCPLAMDRNCHVCFQEVSGANICKKCKRAIHLIWGTPGPGCSRHD